MRWLWRVGLLAAIVVLLAAIGLLRYIRPEQELDLHYESISIQDKVRKMALARRMTVELDEHDANNLLKERLSKTEPLPSGIRIIGAKCRLSGDKLTVQAAGTLGDLVPFGEKLPFGIEAEYRLRWQSPDVVAEFQHARIKSLNIPREWSGLKDVSIRMTGQLPPFIGVRNVRFLESSVAVDLYLSLSNIRL